MVNDSMFNNYYNTATGISVRKTLASVSFESNTIVTFMRCPREHRSPMRRTISSRKLYSSRLNTYSLILCWSQFLAWNRPNISVHHTRHSFRWFHWYSTHDFQRSLFHRLPFHMLEVHTIAANRTIATDLIWMKIRCDLTWRWDFECTASFMLNENFHQKLVIQPREKQIAATVLREPTCFHLGQPHGHQSEMEIGWINHHHNFIFCLPIFWLVNFENLFRANQWSCEWHTAHKWFKRIINGVMLVQSLNFRHVRSGTIHVLTTVWRIWIANCQTATIISNATLYGPNSCARSYESKKKITNHTVHNSKFNMLLLHTNSVLIWKGDDFGFVFVIFPNKRPTFPKFYLKAQWNAYFQHIFIYLINFKPKKPQSNANPSRIKF